MAAYQNIFTQVQLRAAPEIGPRLPAGDSARDFKPWFSGLMGSFGNAQIGPFYLGTLGIVSIFCGFIAFEIIGLNMLASVNWSWVQFVRQLPWLALEPPAPQYGLSVIPPLAQGGWWLMAGFFLTTSIILWWVRSYNRARALGIGTHTTWAFASAIWLYLVLGFIRPVLMGSWAESVPFGIFPHLDWTAALSTAIRQPVLQPFPLPCRLCSCMDRCCCFAMHGATILGGWSLRWRARDSNKSLTAVQRLRASWPLLALDHGLQRILRWSRFTAGRGGLPCSAHWSPVALASC